jgi:hypothetical protein
MYVDALTSIAGEHRCGRSFVVGVSKQCNECSRPSL